MLCKWKRSYLRERIARTNSEQNKELPRNSRILWNEATSNWVIFVLIYCLELKGAKHKILMVMHYFFRNVKINWNK